MADVMVLAIFMSFIAFNGVICSGQGDIRRRVERSAGVAARKRV
jgi:hypothetical protein